MVGGAEQVDHDDVRTRRLEVGRAEWQVQDGSQVLFELAGDCPVDGPVAGVVGAHGQLVDEHALVRSLTDDEHLDGEDAGDTQLGGDAFADAAGLGGGLGADADGGCGDLGAHAVHLHGGGDRPGRDLAGGAACQQGGDLPGEGHQGLGQEGAVPPPGGHVLRAVGDGHAVPVVAASRGLDDEGPADDSAEAFEFLGVGNARPRRAGDPHVGEAGAHLKLVLGVQEGAGGGLDGHDSRRLVHGLGRDVLVFEGEDVRAVDERADGVQVGGSSGGLVDGGLAG